MANEQDQSEWQNNKEMNIKENSSATADGTSITGDTEESWRPTDENMGESGEAQKPFGENQDPADGQGNSGDPGASEEPTDQPWSPAQEQPPIIIRQGTDIEDNEDDGRHPIKIF